MQEIEEINREIQKLTEKRNAIASKKLDDKKQEFLKLEWLKGATVVFNDSTFGPYGFREYYLRLPVPGKYNGISWTNVINEPLRGTSSQYYANIMIRKADFDTLQIYSSNAKLMKEFIVEFDLKFSSVSFDKNTLSLYNVVNDRR